jgi:hypothetical protein
MSEGSRLYYSHIFYIGNLVRFSPLPACTSNLGPPAWLVHCCSAQGRASWPVESSRSSRGIQQGNQIGNWRANQKNCGTSWQELPSICQVKYKEIAGVVHLALGVLLLEVDDLMLQGLALGTILSPHLPALMKRNLAVLFYFLEAVPLLWIGDLLGSDMGLWLYILRNFGEGAILLGCTQNRR